MSFKINEKCISSTSVDGSSVILNIESGEYLQLNETSTFIWNLLSSGSTEKEILEKLISEYEGNRELIKEDLDDFIQEAVKKDIVKI